VQLSGGVCRKIIIPRTITTVNHTGTLTTTNVPLADVGDISKVLEMYWGFYRTSGTGVITARVRFTSSTNIEIVTTAHLSCTNTVDVYWAAYKSAGRVQRRQVSYTSVAGVNVTDVSIDPVKMETAQEFVTGFTIGGDGYSFGYPVAIPQITSSTNCRVMLNDGRARNHTINLVIEY
jgi:hypothetical protein